MNSRIPRRTWLAAAPFSLAAADTSPVGIPENFPSQPVPIVREMVTVAHGNTARVRELLAARPTLANAAWDWGFGDWETALGAASHVGNRDIAGLLLANGAHPTIFSAAMLGQLDVVKAFIAARPGIQTTLGPHGIPLLAHARAGGAPAKPVFDYLQELGDAGGQSPAQISEEEMANLQGIYQFGPGANDRIEIALKGKQLNFTRKGAFTRPIHYVGDREFRPAGAPGVRIRFNGSGPETTLSIHDADLIVTARRAAN